VRLWAQQLAWARPWAEEPEQAVQRIWQMHPGRSALPLLERLSKCRPACCREGNSARSQRVGEALFAARFTTLDGAGRPEATQAIDPTRRKHPREQMFLRSAGPDAGSCAACHNQPAIGGAGDFVTNVFVSEGFESADFDSLDPQFSSERGTNHLFGAGLVELLAREMSR
jgi:hypothetical protein